MSRDDGITTMDNHAPKVTDPPRQNGDTAAAATAHAPDEVEGVVTTPPPPPARPAGRRRPSWFMSLFSFRFFSDEMPKISPHAVVDPSAEIADDVEVGPFCVIGPNVKIASGCRLLNSVTILGNTTLGKDNICFPNSVLGAIPQDKKFRGEMTRLEIGNSNVFREAVTIHVGTDKGGGVTKIGDNNLLMVNAHVGHDAVVGSNCVLSNNVMLAGHVLVGDYVAMMGGVGVHHFVTIGDYAYIGGYARVHHDVPPYCKIDGSDEIRGLNKKGLERSGVALEHIAALDKVYRTLFVGRRKPFSVAMAEYESMNGDLNPHVRHLIEFLKRRNAGRNGRYLESTRRG